MAEQRGLRLRLLPWLRDLWLFTIAPPGKLLTIACILTGAMGSISIQFPVYHVFCFLAGLWGTAFAAAWLLRPRLRVRTGAPARVTVGAPVRVPFTIKNDGRWTAVGIRAGLAGNFRFFDIEHSLNVPELKSSESVSIHANYTPRKRGVYPRMNLDAWSQFPFGLFRMGRAHAANEALIVYPKFTPIDRFDIPMGRRFQPGGIALTSGTGESPEYIGNREYRQGDSIRRIDFKAWARLAKPAVREYQEEYYCRVAVVLDTFVPGSERAPREGFPNLEAGISLTAALADAMARGEHIIDLFAAGPDLYVFRSGRSIAHFENVLEILACLDVCRTNPFETIQPALVEELERITTLVAVFLAWDDTRANMLRAARDAGCSVVAFVVSDDPSTIDESAAEFDVRPLDPSDILAGTVTEV